MSTSKANEAAIRTSEASPKNGQITHHKWTQGKHLFSFENSQWYKAKTEFGANITVRKISLTNIGEEAKIVNDIRKTIFFENEDISSVLKFRHKENDGGNFCILYESFKSNLETFFNENITNLSAEDFLEIVKNIIDAVGIVHSKNIVLKNVSSSNMAYCLDNNKARIKIFNLTEAEEVQLNFEDVCSVDIRSVGVLFLSIAIQGKNLNHILNSSFRYATFDQKVNLIFNEIKNVAFIESFKIKSFANLIISMLEAPGTSIDKFKDHPFFWGEQEMEKMIKIVNNCVDKSSGAKDVKLIEKLNEKLFFTDEKENSWRSKLDDEVKACVQGKFKETGCELVRFFRNKVVHRNDLDEKINPYFLTQGGVFKYFFKKFDDLFYILSSFYEENRLYEKSMKVEIDPKKHPQVVDNASNNQPQPSSSSKKRAISPSQNRDIRMNYLTSEKYRNDQIRCDEKVKKQVERNKSMKKDKN